MQGKSQLRTHQAFRFSSFTFPIIAVTLVSVAFVVYLQFFNVADTRGMGGSGSVRSEDINVSDLSTKQKTHLLDFAATENEHGHVFHWISVDGPHISYYAVERSGDLMSWEPVSKVPLISGADMQKTYMTRDLDPPKGVVHYRLKQVNYDGSYRDLEVISMESVEEKRSSIDIILSMLHLSD